MNVCKKCGFSIPEGVLFCKKCGTPVQSIETDEMDGLLPRTPFEKLEQYIYDGNDRNILARYCKGKFVAKPFA